jgi:hypothetical protein
MYLVGVWVSILLFFVPSVISHSFQIVVKGGGVEQLWLAWGNSKNIFSVKINRDKKSM